LRHDALDLLGYEVAGDGTARAHPAQRVQCGLLGVSVISLLLAGPSRFVDAISWQIVFDPLWAGNDINLLLKVLPCTADSYACMYLPMLATLVAIPLERLFNTFAEDPTFTSSSSMRAAELGLRTLLKMLAALVIHSLITPMLAVLQYMDVGLS